MTLSKRAQLCWNKEEVELGNNLVQALRHPFRVHALHVLNKQIASAKELSQEVGCDVSLMSYHVRELEKLDFVEIVREEKRRGAVEHFFRGTGRAIFYAEEWVLVPEPIRAAVVGMELRITGKLLSESLSSETFEKRPDRHHSLQQALVDEQGWADAMSALETCMGRIIEVEQESAERRLKTHEKGIPLAVSLIGFERLR
jgi:DNA-binding transcriptional regulator GbsR (MarR family)